jgi:hypothetical protein
MDRKDRKRVIGRGSLYFFKRSMYLYIWELGKIGFSTYYMDLTTKIGVQENWGEKKDVRPCLCIYMSI